MFRLNGEYNLINLRLSYLLYNKRKMLYIYIYIRFNIFILTLI